MASQKKSTRSKRPSYTSDNNNDADNNDPKRPIVVNLKPVMIWATLLLLVYLPLAQIMNRSLLGHDFNNNFKLDVQSEPDLEERLESELANEEEHSSRQRQHLRNQNTRDEEEEEEDEDHDAGYDEDGFPYGVLSQKPDSFFKELQDEIDNDSLEARCHRYGFAMTPPNNKTLPKLPRRIFFGSLLAEEPWELLQITATETYGIFEAMVFVEGNRTQMFYPREFKRTNEKHTTKMQNMFGMNPGRLQIRQYVNENPNQDGLWREHLQRQEILRGWKDLGMTHEDIGYITDADETFSRDFLRAVQQCPYVEAMDYESHKCLNTKAKIVGATQVFETSPTCVTEGRAWFHPDMIIGACVEEIGDSNVHPIAPRRDGYVRADGWGRDCNTAEWERSFGKLPNRDFHPLFSAGDFRSNCGGHCYEAKNGLNRTKYSAFHFHNFFAKFESTRRKYLTYGHPRPNAMIDPLEEIDNDLKLMVRCVLDQTDGYHDEKDAPEEQRFQRVEGNFEDMPKPWPIYFHDATYRRKKHERIRTLVLQDEHDRQQRMNWTKHEQMVNNMKEEVKEAKRLIYDREKKLGELRKQPNRRER